MAKNKAINKGLPSGTRDYAPGLQIKRQKMLDTIRGVFELYGFAPLETSSLQRREVLTGGDENFEKQIFKAGNGEETDTALRFDLTVPLARYVATMGDKIERPFKRYEIGKVWRGEKAQAGRYREFIQCDADIVGSSSLFAEAEIISLVYETMRALGFEKFVIKINNRKIFGTLSVEALRILDKLDKVGWARVEKELATIGISKKEILKILDSEDAEVNEVIKLAKNFGVPDKFLKFDQTVVRGLGYYTGVVFETVLTEEPKLGSVFGGGRYDNLVERFGGAKTSAVGVSAGVDRLFIALEKENLVANGVASAEVLVLNFEKECERMAAQIASDLRRAGISTEIYFGKEETLKGQLAYAVKREFKFVVIVGKDEKEKGVAQIKDMIARTQKEVPVVDIARGIKTWRE